MQDPKTFSADVPYLDNSDFDSKGNLLPGKGKVGVVMMQGNFCGYCSDAKPEYQRFYDDYKQQYFIASLQVDDKKAAKLMERIKTIVQNYSAVPFYLGFSPSGKLLVADTSPRSYENLVKFAKSIRKA